MREGSRTRTWCILLGPREEEQRKWRAATGLGGGVGRAAAPVGGGSVGAADPALGRAHVTSRPHGEMPGLAGHCGQSGHMGTSSVV